MATRNVINANTAGIVGYDGASNFTGSTLTQNSVVLGASTSSTLTNVSGLGTSGQLLTSNGPGTPPTWQTAASAGLSVVSGSLTNSQIKNLHATPIEAIAAPGAGKILVPVSCIMTLNYGGNNAFTAIATQSIGLWWGTAQATSCGLVYLAVAATQSQAEVSSGGGQSTGQSGGDFGNYTQIANTHLVFYNNAVGEIGGNAANDNTVSYIVYYFTVTIP